MTYHSKVRDFVVGIDYDNPFDYTEEHSHMTLRRKVNIEELIQELTDILHKGSTYPQFPPEANPSIVYAWDLTSEDDGDIYHEIIEQLEKNNRKDNY
jgi:thymidylate synthase